MLEDPNENQKWTTENKLEKLEYTGPPRDFKAISVDFYVAPNGDLRCGIWGIWGSPGNVFAVETAPKPFSRPPLKCTSTTIGPPEGARDAQIGPRT